MDMIDYGKIIFDINQLWRSITRLEHILNMRVSWIIEFWRDIMRGQLQNQI